MTGDDVLGCNLFAYCGNNPIIHSDPNGQAFITAIFIAVAAVCVIVSAKYAYKEANKKSNSKVDKNSKTTTKGKIVNDQNGATGSNFKYGAYPAKRNACETIAVHNAKVLKGDNNSTLSKTMTDFQNAGAMIGFGTFGSNPYAIGNVLSNEGIEYSRVGLTEMTQPGVYIISFWNDNAPWNGLHTVAVSCYGTTYTAYNFISENKGDVVSMSYFENRFICAYYLG